MRFKKEKCESMNFASLILLLLFPIFVHGPDQKNNRLPHSIVITVTSYEETKRAVLKIKSQIVPERITEDSLSSVVTDILVNKLIPHWLGTPWSFEGHTSIPGQGKIACGYFVSTTLQDMGFNLNRYKLAQQLPIHEAKILSLGNPLIEIVSTSTEERIRQLQTKLKEGIYFIGFDQSHVGYIQKKNDNLFVIHSNYIGSQGVVIENIVDSIVFSSYDRIYISEISTNQLLLKKWLMNEAIVVVTE